MFDQALRPQGSVIHKSLSLTNCRGHKASSCQAQTSRIRRQSKMNTKRWAIHMFCPSPWGILSLQCRTTTWKLTKRKRRTKALGSVVFLEIHFYRLPLRICFNFPDVKTMMLKAHPLYSGTRTFIPIFCKQKICFMRSRQNNKNVFYADCSSLKQFPIVFKFHFLHNS